MEKVAIVFTVFFEDPFWCGVYQRQEGTRLEVARVVFGQEPKDYEVLAFLLQNWKRLRFGKTRGEKIVAERKNPKRMQREVRKQMGCCERLMTRNGLEFHHISDGSNQR